MYEEKDVPLLLVFTQAAKGEIVEENYSVGVKCTDLFLLIYFQ